MAHLPSSSNTAGTRSSWFTSSYFTRRLSRASVLTEGTINTVLPEYTPIDSLESPPGFGEAQYYDGFSPVARSGPTDEADFPLADPEASPTTEENHVYTTQSPELNAPYGTTPSSQSRLHPRHSVLLDHTAVNTPPVDKRSQPFPPQQDFDYSYPIRSNKPWANLHLLTRERLAGNPCPSKAQPKIPQFWGCDLIRGSLELDLESPLNIQQINIGLKGKIATSALGGDTFPFFSQEVILWNKSFPDPHPLSGSEFRPLRKFDGRFHGRYHLPFSFAFPTHVDLETKKAVLPSGVILSPLTLIDDPNPRPSFPTTSKGKETGKSLFPSSSRSPPNEKTRSSSKSMPTVCPIPQTFDEKGLNISIGYELSVTIVLGRFKPYSKIKTIITHLPALETHGMSNMRRQAYEAGSTLCGPVTDPSGWYSLPAATIHGELSPGGRRTKVECILHLANPLSYARGTVLPCYLTLASDDSDVLDHLANPKAPRIRLMRQLFYFSSDDGYDAGEGLGRAGGRNDGVDQPFATFVPGVAAHPGKMHEQQLIEHEVALAVWWVPPKDVIQETCVRYLEGEIHLDPNLQPSCACTILSIEYYVEMLPLRSRYFTSDASGEGKARARPEVVSSQSVEITTLFKPEDPLPIPLTRRPKAFKLRPLRSDAIIEEPDS